MTYFITILLQLLLTLGLVSSEEANNFSEEQINTVYDSNQETVDDHYDMYRMGYEDEVDNNEDGEGDDGGN